MANPREIMLGRNADRRREPRVVSASQDGVTTLVVVFNRDMDEQMDTAVFRTCDETNGVQDWSGGEWTDSRTLTLSTAEEVAEAFTGTRRLLYMSGNIRALGRFRLPLRHRCDTIGDA